MDFLGVGPWEALLVLVVLLIFVGPSRLPEVAKGLSKAYRKFKEASKELSQEIEGMADEVKGELKDVRKEVDRATDSKTGVAKDLDDITKDIDGVRKDVRTAAQSVTSDPSKGSKKVAEAGEGTVEGRMKSDGAGAGTPGTGG
jgi:sec-independent protein translocase protein TatA